MEGLVKRASQVDGTAKAMALKQERARPVSGTAGALGRVCGSGGLPAVWALAVRWSLEYTLRDTALRGGSGPAFLGRLRIGVYILLPGSSSSPH